MIQVREMLSEDDCNLQHFNIQLMHTTLKNVELLK